jgi:hypothetical protein
MSDEVPLYVFVADEPVRVGTVVVKSDGTLEGSITQTMYDTLRKSSKPWFFGLHSETSKPQLHGASVEPVVPMTDPPCKLTFSHSREVCHNMNCTPGRRR